MRTPPDVRSQLDKLMDEFTALAVQVDELIDRVAELSGEEQAKEVEASK